MAFTRNDYFKSTLTHVDFSLIDPDFLTYHHQGIEPRPILSAKFNTAFPRESKETWRGTLQEIRALSNPNAGQADEKKADDNFQALNRALKKVTHQDFIPHALFLRQSAEPNARYCFAEAIHEYNTNPDAKSVIDLLKDKAGNDLWLQFILQSNHFELAVKHWPKDVLNKLILQPLNESQDKKNPAARAFIM